MGRSPSPCRCAAAASCRCSRPSRRPRSASTPPRSCTRPTPSAVPSSRRGVGALLPPERQECVAVIEVISGGTFTTRRWCPAGEDARHRSRSRARKPLHRKGAGNEHRVRPRIPVGQGRRGGRRVHAADDRQRGQRLRPSHPRRVPDRLAPADLSCSARQGSGQSTTNRSPTNASKTPSTITPRAAQCGKR